MSSNIGAMSTGGLEERMELATISGELTVTGDVVDEMDIPVLGQVPGRLYQNMLSFDQFISNSID